MELEMSYVDNFLMNVFVSTGIDRNFIVLN